MMTEQQGADILTELHTLNRTVWFAYGLLGSLCLIGVVIVIIMVARLVAGYMGPSRD